MVWLLLRFLFQVFFFSDSSPYCTLKLFHISPLRPWMVWNLIRLVILGVGHFSGGRNVSFRQGIPMTFHLPLRCYEILPLSHLGDPLAEVQAHFTQTVAPHFLHGPTHLGIVVSPLKSASCFFHQPQEVGYYCLG